MTDDDTTDEPEESGLPDIIRFYMLAVTGFMGFIFGAVLHVILG